MPTPRGTMTMTIIKNIQVPLPTLAVVGILLCSSFSHASTSSLSIGVPGVHGGVVTTTESTATEIGAKILQEGGNAIDAAAAVAFALNVVEPQSSGIGGGGFMMVYLAKTKDTFFVDSRETAPALAEPDMFLDHNGKPFPFSIRSTSGVSVGVPGMVRGIAMALQQWGTFSLAEILAPAIQLATNGVRISKRLAENIQAGIHGGRLGNEPGNPAYEIARKVFSPGGISPPQGTLLVQPELAKTFRRLAKHGPEAFYSGKIAEAIVSTQRQTRETTNTTSQKKLQGRMTMQDLADYRPITRQPLEAMYRGYRIQSSPPPSSGGLTVLHILKLLERFPIGDHTQDFAFGSIRTLNVMIEAMRLGFSDRAVWMGDEDFVSIPTKGLLDEKYIQARSALIHPDKRQKMVTAGNPLPYEGPAGSQSVNIKEPASLIEAGMNTTHFTIIDRAGNIVTYTNTIESRWGTGLMVSGFGFLLNNELADFNAVPALNNDPKNFNPGANDVAPGKRPRSSMAPTIVFHHDRPVAAYGSPGGSTIINSIVNVTLNLIDHKMSIQEAIDAPRLSQTNTNGIPKFESGFSEEIVKRLNAMGHRTPNELLEKIGAIQAVVIDETNGKQYGGADRRRGGSVISLKQKYPSP